MVYDEARGLGVLFGGDTGTSYFADTFTWNGDSWTQRLVSGPAARSYHAMVYDSARQVAVVFGGTNGSSYFGDTWEWDGATWTLRTNGGPAARAQMAMAYDSQRGVTVLFGGWDGSTRYGDTWEWDGTSWTQRLVAGPTARSGSCMTYDAMHHVSLLVGGGPENGPYPETWTWDGSAWTMMSNFQWFSDLSLMPLVYDSARQIAVLYTGSDLDTSIFEWDGTAWQHRHAQSPPQGRSWAAAAYDAARGETIIQGGFTAGSIQMGDKDTWGWNGSTWAKRSPTGPAAIAGFGLTFDRDRAFRCWPVG